VIVREVRLANVRCRETLSLVLGERLTILVGPNGAGKTSVLEAVTLALEGRLLRAGNLRDLIRVECGHMRIELDLEDSGVGVVATATYSREGERKLTAGGAPLEDYARWRELVPLRTFVPDDLRLIKGSPRRRRDYLDRLASSCEVGYRSALEQYDAALAQRNALLRTTRHGGESAQFGPWESIMAQLGLRIAAARAHALSSFVAAFQQTHADLTDEAPETLRLIYRTNVAGLDEQEYGARLAGMRDADRQRTYTHLGPHRDDLRLVRNGLDMRDCASQGEQRAALLALVLSEWQYECRETQRPLLLLDDVMSELDEVRRRALVCLLADATVVKLAGREAA
jgi:DNA replication and repair protein RecF